MKLRRYNINIVSFLSVFSGLILISCSEKEKNLDEPYGDLPLKVGARIEGINTTRSYQEKGIVETGNYYLTYVNSDNTRTIGEVLFTGGVGEIKKDTDSSLEWGDIGYDSGSQTISTFYLDNVPFNRGKQDENFVTFSESYNPFKAGELDKAEGSNDLLWGERQISRNTPIINFQLHHCMSLLNIKLTVEKESDVLLEHDLNIDEAVVSISNILQTPEKYDRLTGRLLFPVNEGTIPQDNYKLLTLVNKDWAEDETIVNEGKETTIYTSKDYVLPPQELLTTEERPRLSVSFPTKDGETLVYSGVIPRAMEVKQEDGSTIPMPLSFLREYCLTLHIRLSLDPVEIIFMPVTVVDWVNKGTELITADQAGINDEASFLKFLEVLKQADQNSDSQLERYGYKKNGNWIFNIFSEMIFSDLSSLQGVLKDAQLKNFSFNMHNWNIFITVKETKYVISDSNILLDLLIDGNLPY